MGDKKKSKLDKKTKSKLADLGIRDLQRTPGRLINPSGYIPDEVGAFGTMWGKLKMTGDIAEKSIGFRPKEGAIGVLLSRRKYIDKNGKVKSGIFASSLMRRYTPHTEKEKATWDRMRVLAKIASKYKSELIYPIWEPLVIRKDRKPWSGYHYFMSLNGLAIGSSLNWSKLVISKGKLASPKVVCPNCYRPMEKQIEIIPPRTINRQLLTKNQVGIGILDIITGDFFHISPEQLAEQLEKRFKSCGMKIGVLRRGGLASKMEPLNLIWKLEKVRKHYCYKKMGMPKKRSRFYIYIYYKKDREYSDSICSRIKVCKGGKERGGMPIVIEVRE